MNEQNEKLTPVREPGGKFFAWLENFWYHRKWGVIVTVFFAVVLTVCTLQMCSREDSDIYIMYAGPTALHQREKDELRRIFKEVIPTENGEMGGDATFVDLYILSAAQIEAKKEEIKQIDGTAVVNYEMFKSANEQFDQHIWAGDTVLCLLDPHLYARVHVDGKSGFVPLREILGEKPANAYDDYSIRLSDTEFGKYCGLDKDTLLCLRQKSSLSSMTNKKHTDAYHAFSMEVFKNIVAFKVEE